MQRFVFLIPVLAMTTACTTSTVMPEIVEFSKAVEATSLSVSEKYENDQISAKYSDEYTKAIVAEQAVLSSRNCGSVISLSVDLDDRSLKDFREHCSIGTYREGPDGRPVEVVVTVPDGSEGIEGYNARRTSLILGTYASSLRNLAESEDSATLKQDFGTAAAAVLNLVDTASGLPEGEGLSAANTRVGTAGIAVVSDLLAEAYEARRHALLRTLVTDADPSVQVASRSIAGWYRLGEQDALGDRYDALRTALGEQQEAVLALKGGTGDPDDAIAKTAAVRSLYDGLQVAEEGAAWRAHLAVAEAHAAIKASFDKPDDLKTLKAANDRIANLADKVEGLRKAVDEKSG